MIESSLYEHLSGDSEVAALVSSRVYPAAIPQGAAMPAVAYRLISSLDLDGLDGSIGVRKAAVQVDCYAATYMEVKTLAAAALEALQDFDGTMGTVEQTIVHDCLRIGELDVYFPPDGHAGRHYIPLEFEITYQE
jgi:hypothetical protein